MPGLETKVIVMRRDEHGLRFENRVSAFQQSSDIERGAAAHLGVTILQFYHRIRQSCRAWLECRINGMLQIGRFLVKWREQFG
jgi:hypothetical protein